MRRLYDKKAGKLACHIEWYDSVMELAMENASRKVTSSCFDDMARADIEKNWHGVDSYEEALGLLANGYDAKITPMVMKSAGGNSKRTTFSANVQGFAPIVPLALMGVPQSMIDTKQVAKKTKVLDLFIEVSATCGFDADQFAEAGKEILETVVSLEKQGYRLNLYSAQAYCSEKSADILVVKVKDSGRPLDIRRCSFPLAHPGYFRVIGFDWYSKVPGGKFRDFYGTNIERILGDAGTKEAFKELFGKNAMVLSLQEIMENGGRDEGYVEKQVKRYAGRN